MYQRRYRLIEKLTLPESQRSHGDAWLAADTRTRPEHTVVIRELRFPGSPSMQNRQKARDMAMLHTVLGQHPALPSVEDVFEENDRHFIVFQHIEGISLASLLKRQNGALPERVIAEYGRQLCEILTFFSRQHPPFVHGSITPDTIIVSLDQNKVSLIYLPLFAPGEAPPQKVNAASGYFAPEQTRGSVGPAADLYAVAAIMHHAVTDYDPRERMSFFYPAARRLNPRVTPRMEEILARELHLSIAQRYPRPKDMQADLAALIASYPPASEEALVPVSSPLNQSRLYSLQLRRSSRNRTLLQIGVIGLISLFALIALFTPLLMPMFTAVPQSKSPALDTSLRTELALEQQTFRSKGIGLSDGRFIFDTYPGRDDVSLKQLAGAALQNGDQSRAVSYFSQAISADPTDGEAQIYNENLHVLQSGSPYITIVLGLSFDKNDDDLLRARVDTEGAFLAQYEINRQGLLQHGFKLRILIDSPGADRADVARVTQFIANRVGKGNPDHIVGVVGWPFSSQSIIARDIVASAHVPMVSQTASSVKLSGSSPYFFRVNPPDDAQGSALGTVVVQQFHYKKILALRDPTDPYSVSLADALTVSAGKFGAQVINSPADYFTEATTTVTDYQKVINDAIAQNADLIFIAGFSIDAVRLAHALGNTVRANPNNPALANLKILGGDGLYTNLVLGQGDGPDAQIARTFPQDMRHLIFSAFGDPNEWDLLHVPKSQQPAFFTDWKNFYQSSAVATNNAPPPGNDAILTTDAVQVIAKAASLVSGTITSQSTRDELAALGKGNIPPYQGVSGRIQFDARGNPIDKAIVILDVEQGTGGNVFVLKQVVGTFH